MDKNIIAEEDGMPCFGTDSHWFIRTGDGYLSAVRRQEPTGSSAPLSDYEIIIGRLCEHILEVEQLRSWILKAAPMLSKAACIVVDESIDRLGEIEGVQALVESCPLDFT